MYIVDNPEFRRLVRSKLRVRSLITYGGAAGLILGGILAFSVFIEKQNFRNGSNVFSMAKVLHTYFFTVVGIQLGLVTLFGVALAAQNITLEKERGTFDFQRLVAMGPWRLTIGKLFGATAEATFMALIGVPFAAYACLGSDIPFDVLIQSEIVVFVYALATCSFGLMCSSIAEKTNQATGIVVLLGIPSYIVLNGWNSSSLWSTSSPVFMLTQFAGANYKLSGSSFLFFGKEIPIIAGFLATNLLFMFLCTKITSRRIADVELSFMTPRQGMVAFAILQFLLVGSILSDINPNGIHELQLFHSVNMAALLMLAFALTPGAELVRGRVFRGLRNDQWKIVFERTNRLQDSPALRVMFEICAIYIAVSTAFTLLIFNNSYDKIGYDAVLLTTMIVGVAIAMTGLLLYIQVYTERGYFKVGLLLLILGIILPPMLIWIVSLANHKIKPESVLLVSPIAYIAGLDELNSHGGELACPSICVILAGTFCALSGLRIRFLLDVEDIVKKRGPAARGPTLQTRMAEKAVVTKRAESADGGG